MAAVSGRSHECVGNIKKSENSNKKDVKLKSIMIDAGWPGDGNGGGWKRAEAEAAMYGVLG